MNEILYRLAPRGSLDFVLAYVLPLEGPRDGNFRDAGFLKETENLNKTHWGRLSLRLAVASENFGMIYSIFHRTSSIENVDRYY